MNKFLKIDLYETYMLLTSLSMTS